MASIESNPLLVAKCGLYCGACTKYQKNKCPGCAGNDRATWCGVRNCTSRNGYATCADCTLKPIEECKEFHGIMARFFGVLFNSDRPACITRIKEVGVEAYADEMVYRKQVSIKRR